MARTTRDEGIMEKDFQVFQKLLCIHVQRSHLGLNLWQLIYRFRTFLASGHFFSSCSKDCQSSYAHDIYKYCHHNVLLRSRDVILLEL